MGWKFFTDFKSSNGIGISWLVQVLSNFNWFQGSPWGWWIGEWGGVWVCEGVPCMHACTHMHMEACTHVWTCMLNMLNMLNMDSSMSVVIWKFYTCIHVCVCMCMHVCACWDTPTHLPPSQSYREPKTAKFNKSWTNQDNSILFEDSLPLNIPKLI